MSRTVAQRSRTARVAAQPFLSPRTIDYHLRKVVTKHEITSRADLAGTKLPSRTTGDPTDATEPVWRDRRHSTHRRPQKPMATVVLTKFDDQEQT